MYENKYVKRGEIYSIKSGEYDDPTGSLSRPGLIISNNDSNSSKHNTVIVAMLTTKDYAGALFHYGPIKNTGRVSYVCCENIATVSKMRIGNLMGSLSENQMKEIESLLDEVLDLGYIDNTPLKEKEAECEALRLQLEESKAENAALKKKEAAHEDELLNRDIEIAVAKRMYEKAVGIIAAMRAESDLPVNPKFARDVRPPKPKVETLTLEEPALVDINTASFDELKRVGFSDNLAVNIIHHRPYTKIEDIKKKCSVSAAQYGIVKKRICCVPVKSEAEPKVEKINVNTASVKEIKNGTGMGINPAYSVVGYRKAHGTIKSLDELAGLKYWTKSLVEKHRDKLEV